MPFNGSVEFDLNHLGREMTEDEAKKLVPGYDVLIAGTEPLTRAVLERSPTLKLIARVGIGLDSVDLAAAAERGIRVSYTPDAPSAAVAELAVSMMLSLLRMTHKTDRAVRQGVWFRWMGRRLANLTVGVVGVGRIGKRVIRHLQGFESRVLAHDLEPDLSFGSRFGVQWVDKDTLYREADLITVHVPLGPDTRNLVAAAELDAMKSDAILINTSRGGIVNEHDLKQALKQGSIGGAGVDVFEHEPYSGELAVMDNVLLTCHMGSCSVDCRLRMEVEATEDAIRFCLGQPLLRPVPEEQFPPCRQN